MKVMMKNIRIHFALQCVLVLLLFISSFHTLAQSATVEKKKLRHIVFYGGIGPNIYFNNLVLAKNEVNTFNYSVVGRIMWEPEYRLSLGFESGYNRLYTINNSLVHIINGAVPLQFVVSIKFLKTFYGNFSYGRTILINKVDSPTYGNFDATAISLADVTLTVGYKRKLNERFSLGPELKYYYASKANDNNIALVFMCGYHFK
jgi:hypothetical protein